jgi:pSer/pThr/pTyr-binding forkhead associated (FHA) protein
MARLVFMNEKFRGRVYEFAVETTTVGRGQNNALVISDDSVSETHCQILVYGPEVIVRDMGSTNGTYVNGVQLRGQQRPLRDGEIVIFGAVQARLELGPPADSGTATDATAMYSFRRSRAEKK